MRRQLGIRNRRTSMLKITRGKITVDKRLGEETDGSRATEG